MTTERPLLDHENLDVYRVAVEFLALSLEVLDGLPRQRRELRSQLERAAMSIPLNIAEGTGKPSAADRARYYATARGRPYATAEPLAKFPPSGLVPGGGGSAGGSAPWSWA